MPKMKSISFESLSRATRYMAFPVELSPAEIADTTAALAAIDQTIVDVETEKAKEMRKFNGELKKLRTDHLQLLDEISKRRRDKDVQVEIGYDWKAGRKYIKRLDTNELVDVEGQSISDEERQLMLNGVEPQDFEKHLHPREEEADVELEEDEEDEEE
jgi:hypothetical protein